MTPNQAETPRASVVVAVIHYRTYGELPDCLAALAAQRSQPLAVSVVDADGSPELRASVQAAWPSVRFEPVVNRGYAGNANHAVAWAAREHPAASYLLLLNPDVRLEPEFVGSLSEAMEQHPNAALATGKLVRADGVTLDSAGIRLPRHRRPRDRGSEQKDCGQYDRTEYVFGASGAALLLRRAALAELAVCGELFDEDFFMYHEDTDLSWRCHHRGYRVLYEPKARAVHERGWKRERRFEVPIALRRHSFKNHYLQLVKNERALDLLRNLPALLGWELLRLGFALLRDPAVLPAYLDAARLLPAAWRKRRLVLAKPARSSQT